MDIKNYILRELQNDDYYMGYIQLLSQLSICNIDNITYEDFCMQLSSAKLHGSYIYVIEYDNTIIACGTLLLEYKIIHDLSKVAHIEDVVVNKNMQGKGIGKYLIEHLINKSKELGCYKVILNCSNNNKDFYIKCGFNNTNYEMSIYNK